MKITSVEATTRVLLVRTIDLVTSGLIMLNSQNKIGWQLILMGEVRR